MKFASILMVALAAATCPTADNTANNKLTVAEMKADIVTAKATQTTDNTDLKDADASLKACHATNNAKTPVEIANADQKECLSQSTTLATKTAAVHT